MVFCRSRLFLRPTSLNGFAFSTKRSEQFVHVGISRNSRRPQRHTGDVFRKKLDRNKFAGRSAERKHFKTSFKYEKDGKRSNQRSPMQKRRHKMSYENRFRPRRVKEAVWDLDNFGSDSPSTEDLNESHETSQSLSNQLNATNLSKNSNSPNPPNSPNSPNSPKTSNQSNDVKNVVLSTHPSEVIFKFKPDSELSDAEFFVSPPKSSRRSNREAIHATELTKSSSKSETIAKRLARSGIWSRRESERLITARRVAVNGHVLETPAVRVTDDDEITVDDKPVSGRRQRLC